MDFYSVEGPGGPTHFGPLGPITPQGHEKREGHALHSGANKDILGSIVGIVGGMLGGGGGSSPLVSSSVTISNVSFRVHNMEAHTPEEKALKQTALDSLQAAAGGLDEVNTHLQSANSSLKEWMNKS